LGRRGGVHGPTSAYSLENRNIVNHRRSARQRGWALPCNARFISSQSRAGLVTSWEGRGGGPPRLLFAFPPVKLESHEFTGDVGLREGRDNGPGLDNPLDRKLVVGCGRPLELGLGVSQRTAQSSSELPSSTTSGSCERPHNPPFKATYKKDADTIVNN
jgi:hypothetical protein